MNKDSLFDKLQSHDRNKKWTAIKRLNTLKLDSKERLILNRQLNRVLESAFKVYKGGKYENVHAAMSNTGYANDPSAKHAANVMRWWYGRKGEVNNKLPSEKLYRGMRQGKSMKSGQMNVRSFTSWTTNVGIARKFAGKDGSIFVMNSSKAPRYVKYTNTKPAFYNKVGGNTEHEVLLPPGRILFGEGESKTNKLKSLFGTVNCKFVYYPVSKYLPMITPRSKPSSL